MHQNNFYNYFHIYFLFQNIYQKFEKNTERNKYFNSVTTSKYILTVTQCTWFLIWNKKFDGWFYKNISIHYKHYEKKNLFSFSHFFFSNTFTKNLGNTLHNKYFSNVATIKYIFFIFKQCTCFYGLEKLFDSWFYQLLYRNWVTVPKDAVQGC